LEERSKPRRTYFFEPGDGNLEQKRRKHLPERDEDPDVME
jgi:hypothetical protein